MLSTYLQVLSFSQSNADSSLHILHQPSMTIYLLVYVDDILIIGMPGCSITNIIAKLNDHFQMRNMGNISTLLGITTINISNGLYLHQTTYAQDLLNHVRMYN